MNNEIIAAAMKGLAAAIRLMNINSESVRAAEYAECLISNSRLQIALEKMMAVAESDAKPSVSEPATEVAQPLILAELRKQTTLLEVLAKQGDFAVVRTTADAPVAVSAQECERLVILGINAAAYELSRHVLLMRDDKLNQLMAVLMSKLNGTSIRELADSAERIRVASLRM